MHDLKVIEAKFDNLRVTIPSGFLSKLNEKKASDSKSIVKKANKQESKQTTKQKSDSQAVYLTVFDQSPNLNTALYIFA